MKRGVLILSALVAITCTEQAETDVDWSACDRPSDCVVTSSWCCGVEGGEAVAIRADLVDSYKARCPGGACPSECLCECGWVEQLAATCGSGRCELVSPTPGELACVSDEDCVQVSARCGACDDGLTYCVVTPHLVVSRSAADAFGDRVCGETEALCDPHPTSPSSANPFIYTTPRCVAGICQPVVDDF